MVGSHLRLPRFQQLSVLDAGIILRCSHAHLRNSSFSCRSPHFDLSALQQVTTRIDIRKLRCQFTVIGAWGEIGEVIDFRHRPPMWPLLRGIR
jgi:hypothetical protein